MPVTVFEAATSFGFGIIASGSPCAIPMYPGFIAYLSGRGGSLQDRGGVQYLGVAVLFGVLTTMLATGAIIFSAGVSLGRGLTSAIPLVDAILVVLGVLLLLNRNPFSRFTVVKSVPKMNSPFLQAYIYGALYGPIALPCNAPLVLSIVAFTTTLGELFDVALLFLLFGLGIGLPLLAISMVSKARASWLIRQFTRRTHVFNRVAGLILISLAIYNVTVVYSYIQIYI